jgi:hypothetical protein
MAETGVRGGAEARAEPRRRTALAYDARERGPGSLLFRRGGGGRDGGVGWGGGRHSASRFIPTPGSTLARALYSRALPPRLGSAPGPFAPGRDLPPWTRESAARSRTDGSGLRCAERGFDLGCVHLSAPAGVMGQPQHCHGITGRRSVERLAGEFTSFRVPPRWVSLVSHLVMGQPQHCHGITGTPFR